MIYLQKSGENHIESAFYFCKGNYGSNKRKSECVNIKKLNFRNI